MILFQEKQISVAEQVDLLAQKEKILTARKKYSPNIMNKLIILFLSLSISLLIFFDFHINIYIRILFGITILVCLCKPFDLKRIEKQIETNRKEQNEKADELKQSVKHTSDLYKEFREAEKKSKKVTMDYDSYPLFCHIWDKIFHDYIYNPNALICPKCKSNNGLYDMSKSQSIDYICPNCQNHVFSNYKFSNSDEK